MQKTQKNNAKQAKKGRNICEMCGKSIYLPVGRMDILAQRRGFYELFFRVPPTLRLRLWGVV